ncbi:MAG TPA: hypothetical protein PKV42_00435 [Thiobacillus sp.]|nr:hypothetical protein [Thiobacillus sp.]HQT33487.1 hypothetical protein [Thiobacillus sp.]
MMFNLKKSFAREGREETRRKLGGCLNDAPINPKSPSLPGRSGALAAIARAAPSPAIGPGAGLLHPDNRHCTRSAAIQCFD